LIISGFFYSRRGRGWRVKVLIWLVKLLVIDADAVEPTRLEKTRAHSQTSRSLLKTLCKIPLLRNAIGQALESSGYVRDKESLSNEPVEGRLLIGRRKISCPTRRPLGIIGWPSPFAAV
jgi:hypothetical protein